MGGDHVTVEADGTIRLLGRGSMCINTGGEKVFPEEVEEVLKRQPGIADAAVFGMPDDRLGEVIVATVEPAPDSQIDEFDMIAVVRAALAPFKAPRRVLTIASLGRAPNGKVDYATLRGYAAEQLTPDAEPEREARK